MKKMSEVSSYDRTRAGQPLRHTICSQRPQLTFLWMLHKITATETSQRHLSYGTRQPPIFFIRKIRQRNEAPNPNYRRSGSYKLDRRRFLQTSYAKNVEFEIKVEPLGLGPSNRLSI